MKTILLTFRKLSKNKTATSLGIAGLVAGLVCVLYIFFWVTDEVSHDRFHKNIDEIVVVHAFLEGGNEVVTFDGCPPAVGPAMKEEYPEVLEYARYIPAYQQYLISGESNKSMERTALADFSLFDIFSFSFIYGGVGTPGVPRQIILTQKAAQSIFGDNNPVGKLVKFNNEYNMTVVGVIENLPDNSSINFDVIVPLEMIELLFNVENFLTTWYNNGFITYGLLNNRDDFNKIATTITNRIQKEMPSSTNYLRAYRFKDNYLYEKNNIRNVKMFSMIAILVLLAATLNFINLNTARSAKQAKESGIRKSLGATRIGLIRLIYLDVAVVCLIAYLAALAIALIGLPFFNQTIDKAISFTILLTPVPLLVLIAMYLFTVAIAGSYPAFYLSGFSPADTLRSTTMTNKSKGMFRNSLITVIFVISIALFATTIIISRQTNFMQQMDLGFSKDQLIYVDLRGKLKPQANTFKEELSRWPDIISSTIVSHLPTGIGNNGEGWDWEGRDPQFRPLVTNWAADHDLVETLGAKMNEGEYRRANQSGIVINRTFANLIGWDSYAGKTISSYGTSWTITGVMEDIHFNELSKIVQPMAIYPLEDWAYNHLLIKINTRNVKATFDYIRKTASGIDPDMPVHLAFLNDQYNQQLKSEINLGRLITLFTMLSMLVLCLGLLGVVMFMAEQKTKEIGIRKCMGEQVSSLIIRFVKPFVIAGIVASAIAIPLTWYVMNNWLQSYAHRITLDVWIFAGASILTIIVSVITVAWQSWRAATRNPVLALRYE
ncbi:ABC transporter permease [Alkaliflexus imshenetskii]|uniref:ABC transporter permease n=1 Tax=Alkaliflexus imshenetskii TaxID=286730 RepID=UPI00047DD57C|nr:ABC transporter permease [Alkaliflexus imshenetskii]